MDKEAVKEAVDLLVETKDYAAIRKCLMDIISTQGTIPRRFSGWLLALNSLVGLHAISEEAFANVMTLVESRRQAAPTSNKVDYQRDYMRQRRARLATALQVEQMERGTKFGQIARDQFKRDKMATWMTARDAYIASRGELDWKGRNDAAAEFWSRIDAQLEQRLAELRIKKPRR